MSQVRAVVSVCVSPCVCLWSHTFIFFLQTSSCVRLSALANMGTMLTFSCRAFIHSTSRGRRLKNKRACVCVCECTHKNMSKRQWTNFMWGCCSNCCTSLALCAEVKHVSVPVAKWRDEVEAAVDSVVLDVPSVQPALVSEVLFKLLVDVVLYWLPADANT